MAQVSLRSDDCPQEDAMGTIRSLAIFAAALSFAVLAPSNAPVRAEPQAETAVGAPLRLIPPLKRNTQVHRAAETRIHRTEETRKPQRVVQHHAAPEPRHMAPARRVAS